MRIGVGFWQNGDGIATEIVATLAELGHEGVGFDCYGPLPGDVELVLVYGPFGSVVPVVKQLLALPVAQRPLFAFWMTEQFPDPSLPEWLWRSVGTTRSAIERLVTAETPSRVWSSRPMFGFATRGLSRFRYYGDLHWLKSHGLPDVLAIGSLWTADLLERRGFRPTVAYMGASNRWSYPLNLDRDIPVLWLGKIATSRRGTLLKRMRDQLAGRDIEIMVIDGVEHPYVFGEDRNVLFNRTKVTLNLLREQWDDNSMRYYLAAPCRSLIVTEPTLPHTPFVPGVHFVEAPIEQLADTICHYLSHEDERRQIADNACQLTTTELTMKNGLLTIVNAARGQ
ncbi:MAG: glycosyltransferase [Anaerolineae bacterium]